MWEIVKQVVYFGLRTARVGGRLGLRGGKEGVVWISNESYEAMYGFLRRAPRVYHLAQGTDVTTSTVWWATRAGMQSRVIVESAVRVARERAAAVIIYPGRTLARWAVQDLMTPYTQTVQAYQVFRAGRLLRGATTRVEAAADSWVIRSGRYLDQYGLAPTFGATVKTATRAAIIGTVAYNYDAVRSRVARVPAAIQDVRESLGRARETIIAPSSPVIVEPAARPTPILMAPAPAPASARPAAAIPVAPPVLSARGSPVIIEQSPRVRR